MCYCLRAQAHGLPSFVVRLTSTRIIVNGDTALDSEINELICIFYTACARNISTTTTDTAANIPVAKKRARARMAVSTLVNVLIEELQNSGITHMFGIPGDYCLTLFSALELSSILLVNTCDEQGAGFAADGYARMNGLGAVAVTYGVGALKLVNSTAQAYAERSPVVVISGTPGLAEREGGTLLHHRVGDFETQLRVFEQITAAQALLHDTNTACVEIRRVLEVARRSQRPVYIEIPRDCATMSIAKLPRVVPQSHIAKDVHALTEPVHEVVTLLNASESPVIIAGVELHRLGMQSELLQFLQRAQIPFATTIMGKSVVSENEPGFIGVYSGGTSREDVREIVENADCLLLLGVMLTDINTGIFTAQLDAKSVINATIDSLFVQRHHFPGLTVESLLGALQTARFRERPILRSPCRARSTLFNAVSGAAITVARLFDCLQTRLTEDTAIVADVGDSLFASTDMRVSHSSFIACAYYASLGFAVPASIGIQMAKPHMRPMVIVGDGAFQMTGLELSTSARYGMCPIVIVLDNAGYGTERPMQDGFFNDVHPWQFSAVTELIRYGTAAIVRTETEFILAIDHAYASKSLFVIHVILARDDRSPALSRLTASLGQRVKCA